MTIRPLLFAMLACPWLGCAVEDDVLTVPDPVGDPTASVGRCAIMATGDACTGVPGEAREYVGLLDGDEVPLVDGVFAFGARTSGMDPGDVGDPDASDNPLVGILVRGIDGQELARYTGRHPFAVDDASQALTLPGVFVAAEDPGGLRAGDTVTVHLAIRDRDGVDRWGRVTVVVGR